MRYGTAEAQCGELYLPDGRYAPVVCLLHGGYWRMPHGRDQMEPMARDLVRRGYAVWNLGYRRVGEVQPAWPACLEDVNCGVDRLADTDFGLDLDRVVLVGHSAGGHLALSCAASWPARRVRLLAAIGLAPVTDLLSSSADTALKAAIDALLADSAEAASPLQRLPIGLHQTLIHSLIDDGVPVAMSQSYAQRAYRAGDELELVELPGAGHMDFLDPDSAAYAALCQALRLYLHG
ncbi:alpha/beta hydrolase [Chitinimonas arctica]|uniref:alpha/beta hydrolase n=1 Tax=Chitinimonas arctica TaxID=2594795 RepID=UPI0015D11FF7|nr:alpha/beta hydrolase [Chitinimonas arctica]